MELAAPVAGGQSEEEAEAAEGGQQEAEESSEGGAPALPEAAVASFHTTLGLPEPDRAPKRRGWSSLPRCLDGRRRRRRPCGRRALLATVIGGVSKKHNLREISSRSLAVAQIVGWCTSV